MRRLRLSLSWLMFVVMIIAVDFAFIRAPGGRDDVSLIRSNALILMADILAIGLFLVLTRRGESQPRLTRFEICGLVIVLLYAVCPYLSFCQPLLDVERGFIEAVVKWLIARFWHPLSDFDLDRGNQLGRLVTYVVIIMLPAMLITALLSGLALIGVFLHGRII